MLKSKRVYIQRICQKPGIKNCNISYENKDEIDKGVFYSENTIQTKRLIAIHHSNSPKDSTRDSLDLLPKNQNKK